MLDVLVLAVRKLMSDNFPVNVVFVGDDSDDSGIQHLVSECGLSNNFWFYGACYDEKINSMLLQSADLCVSPGNVGLTAMHSLVYGCPVVTHNMFAMQMPEFEAIIPSVNGDFFEYANVDSLSTVIRRWLSQDKVSLSNVRHECIKVIDDFWNPYFQINVIAGVMD
jgi:glycosyltransferase involved in cell wall biosynthesis